MNMSKWEKIYMKNKEIDDIFHIKYKDVLDYKEKNNIGFLVELGEFVNETKCFKYWTIKKPNKELVLEEYADCLTGVLTFYHDLDMKLEVLEPKEDTNLLEVINDLYLKSTNLMHNMNSALVKEIFILLLTIGKLLDLKEDEVIDAISKKQEVVLNRLNSDY